MKGTLVNLEKVRKVRKVPRKTWEPDYVNISPSDKNDSAANREYAPLMCAQADKQ